MAGKARVHELAKELGVDSKTVLGTLKDMGEFVKSASSTVEAPVVRKLKERLGSPAEAGPKPGRPGPAGNGGRPASGAGPRPGPGAGVPGRPGPRPGPAPAPGRPGPATGPRPAAAPTGGATPTPVSSRP